MKKEKKISKMLDLGYENSSSDGRSITSDDSASPDVYKENQPEVETQQMDFNTYQEFLQYKAWVLRPKHPHLLQPYQSY